MKETEEQELVGAAVISGILLIDVTNQTETILSYSFAYNV